MSINLILGDSYERLKDLPDNSVDSIVTDPPYGLGREPDPVALLRDWIEHGYHEVNGRGFMGKEWDAFVPQPSLWKECLRVLKPGGHLLSFFGTRTYDWGVLAIRIAGFEIRDQIGWLYGSGFPKSLDVSKSIDRRRDDSADILKVTSFMADAADRLGVTRGHVDQVMGTSDMGGWWLSRLQHRCQCPKWDQWLQLKQLLLLSDEFDAEVWRLNGRKGKPGDDWVYRAVVGVIEGTDPKKSRLGMPNRSNEVHTYEITTSATDSAKSWEGWGTALKPAFEPIVVARKPLEGTVAENVLKWRTGAINIAGCRVGCEVIETKHTRQSDKRVPGWTNVITGETSEDIGRWPANIIHDGSDEVIEVFPGEDGDSAAIFFYCAKASKSDRNEGTEILNISGQIKGNFHPTVKPTALMRYLVRLVTPPGGIVLDPFMGSGSTGKAAKLEGFSFIGIELEPDYYEIASARIESATDDTAVKRTKEPDIDPDQISMFSIDGF